MQKQRVAMGVLEKIKAKAKLEAVKFGHDYIGTEHMLLVLSRSKNPEVAKIFQDLDVDEEKILSNKLIVAKGEKIDITKLSLSGRARKVMEEAERIAETEGKEFCPRHLFIALVRDGDGVGALVLQEVLHLNKAELADRVQLALLY